jgi:hypothetical protein
VRKCNGGSSRGKGLKPLIWWDSLEMEIERGRRRKEAEDLSFEDTKKKEVKFTIRSNLASVPVSLVRASWACNAHGKKKISPWTNT